MGADSSKSTPPPKPAGAAFPSAYPSAPPSAPIRSSRTNVNCSICQENFDDNSSCVTTRCGHIFDRHCVTEWILRDRTCPKCRAPASLADLIKVYLTGIQDNPGDLAKMRRQLEEAHYKIAESNSISNLWQSKYTTAQRNLEQIRSELNSKLLTATDASNKELEELRKDKKELIGKMKCLENTKNQKIKSLENKMRFLYKDVQIKDTHREIQDKVMESHVEVIAALKAQLEEMTLSLAKAELEGPNAAGAVKMAEPDIYEISVISENVKDEKPANVDTFAALKAQLEEINLAVAKAGLEFKAAAHSATGAAGIDQMPEVPTGGQQKPRPKKWQKAAVNQPLHDGNKNLNNQRNDPQNRTPNWKPNYGKKPNPACPQVNPQLQPQPQVTRVFRTYQKRPQVNHPMEDYGF